MSRPIIPLSSEVLKAQIAKTEALCQRAAAARVAAATYCQQAEARCQKATSVYRQANAQLRALNQHGPVLPTVSELDLLGAERIEFDYRGYHVCVRNTRKGWQPQLGKELLLLAHATAAEALASVCRLIDHCRTCRLLGKTLRESLQSGHLESLEYLNLLGSIHQGIDW